MDPASAVLIVNLVARGVGVADQLASLARRVKAGETITDAEIEATSAEIDSSVADLDAAVADRSQANDN